MEYKVEQLQKRALCFILNDFDKSYPETLAEAKKNTLVLYRLKKMAIMMYKGFYNLDPEYINDRYQIKNVHYNLRDNYKFKVNHFKKKHGFNSILYTGVKLWNSLPVNFKTCDNINAFKRCLDNLECMNDKCVKCHEFLYHV